MFGIKKFVKNHRLKIKTAILVLEVAIIVVISCNRAYKSGRIAGLKEGLQYLDAAAL